MKNLLWLGDPKSFEAALVGGKAANFSRLARLGDHRHRVPDGFSLPVTVMAEAHPIDLRDEITAAIADLMACHSLPDFVAAVRSSAVDEDGGTASFAGQHETYLNIVGAEEIIQAITRCWESARSERALDYRRQQGLSVERPQLAVLVQQLVAADVAAVAFSANPVTGNRVEGMINASWGPRAPPLARPCGPTSSRNTTGSWRPCAPSWTRQPWPTSGRQARR